MLEPIQTVRITMDGATILTETDTGTQGIGTDLHEALQNLEQSAAAQIFLDTADYLLVTADTQHMIPMLWDRLRPSCRICITEGEPDMESVGAYLKIHVPAATMTTYLAGVHHLPLLKITGEGMQLVP